MLKYFILFRKLELIEEFGENFWLKNLISSLVMLFLYLVISINFSTSYLSIIFYCMSCVYILLNKKSYFDSKSIYGFTSLVKVKRFKLIAFVGKAVTDMTFYGMTFLFLIDHFFLKNIDPIFFVVFLSMYLFEFIVESSKKNKCFNLLFLFYFVASLIYFLILLSDENFIFKILIILFIILIQIFILINLKFHKVTRKKNKYGFVENKYFCFIQDVFLKLLVSIFLLFILCVLFKSNGNDDVYEYFLVIYFLNIFSVNFLGKYYNQKIYSMYRFFNNSFYVKFIDISYMLFFYISLCIVVTVISLFMNLEIGLYVFIEIGILTYCTYQIFKIKFILKSNLEDKFIVFFSSLMVFFSEFILFILLTSNNILTLIILNVVLLFYLVVALLLKKKYEKYINFKIYMKNIEIKG